MSVSALLLCGAGAVQLRRPKPGHPFLAKSCPGWGACAGFVEAAGGNNLIPLRGRAAGTRWRARLQTNHPPPVLLQAAVWEEGASVHLAVNPAPLQLARRKPAEPPRARAGARPGAGKTFLVSTGFGAKPQAGNLFWSVELRASLPARLGCSVLEMLRKQKTVPETTELAKGVAAQPSARLPSQQGRGEESGAVEEPAAMLPGRFSAGRCWVSAFGYRLHPGLSPQHPGGPRRWGLGSSLRALAPQDPAPGTCRHSETALGAIWQTKCGVENVTWRLRCCGRAGLSGAGQTPSVLGPQPSCTASVRQERTNPAAVAPTLGECLMY